MYLASEPAGRGDEFKDSGRYFGEGEYVQIPEVNVGTDFTIMAWFIWMDGAGPLYETMDGQWAFAYNVAGRLAYRFGGVERVTSVAIQSLRDRWMNLVVAKDGQGLVLRIDSDVADHWESAPLLVGVAEAVAMKDAVGFAADLAYFPRRLPDERLDLLWTLGKERV
jgi:hypothetical protein